jgi:hypothetical protein
MVGFWLGAFSFSGRLLEALHFAMSQPTLSFPRITTDEFRKQITALAALPCPPAPPKRPVGRPKRPLSVNDALAATSASQPDNTEPPTKKQKQPRGAYTNWFCTPFIHDILREYAKDHRPALAVQRLQAEAPDRYTRLTHTTLLGWFDTDHKLKPRFAAWLAEGQENVRQNGPVSALEQEPIIEAEIKQTLQQLRAVGTTVNSHIIRWVMKGIIHHRATDASPLRALKLGSSFISSWARKNLNWSWRSSTTAASKLPLDWEEQGLQMAMRIAATMEMYEVSF